MARPPKPATGVEPASTRPVEVLTHADSRRNIPMAELQSLAARMEEAAPVEPVHYPRASPLAEGETRPRNPDLDPQLVWRGMRIRLTEARHKQLQDTGEVELDDAQLVQPPN